MGRTLTGIGLKLVGFDVGSSDHSRLLSVGDLNQLTYSNFTMQSRFSVYVFLGETAETAFPISGVRVQGCEFR